MPGVLAYIYLERRLELGRGVYGGAQQAETRRDRLCPREHGASQRARHSKVS